MSIKSETVTTIVKRLYCDECGKEMKRDMVLMTYPPKNSYVCECGNSETRPDAFPSVQFIDASGNEVR